MGGDEKPEETSGTSPGYGNGSAYWDARYRADPEPFEWLERHEDLRSLLDEISGGNRSVRILHLGCGNSLLTERMYDDGYLNIVNADTSSIVIAQMIARNAKRPEMRWLE